MLMRHISHSQPCNTWCCSGAIHLQAVLNARGALQGWWHVYVWVFRDTGWRRRRSKQAREAWGRRWDEKWQEGRRWLWSERGSEGMGKVYREERGGRMGKIREGICCIPGAREETGNKAATPGWLLHGNKASSTAHSATCNIIFNVFLALHNMPSLPSTTGPRSC